MRDNEPIKKREERERKSHKNGITHLLRDLQPHSVQVDALVVALPVLPGPQHRLFFFLLLQLVETPQHACP